LYFAFAVLFLSLRYAILPNIDYYKGDIERAASRALGNPVSIARIYASWHGVRPNLFLGDVTLRDQTGRQALSLPSVSATCRGGACSVPCASTRWKSRGPTWTCGAQGRQAVRGRRAGRQHQGSDGKGADWLLSQHDIVIRDGRVRWTDEARGAPELALTQVNVLLRNRWRSHRWACRRRRRPAWPRPSMCALTSRIRLSASASRTCRCGRASCMPT
jgi:uncharacterized protein YhdP